MSVGAQLAAARAARGLTIEDLSEATSVRAAVVAAIERDDFGPSGGPAYARGHIRLLAKELKVDPGHLVAVFDDQVGDPAGAPIADALVRHSAAEAELTRTAGVHWARILVLLALLLVVGGAAAYIAYSIVRR